VNPHEAHKKTALDGAVFAGFRVPKSRRGRIAWHGFEEA
jgi:hypothetical protein